MSRIGEDSSKNRTASDVIEKLLRQNSGKARFLVDLRAALPAHRIDAAALDGALAELEKDGAVIVRDHFCADPHLAGADLRVAAWIDTDDTGDPQLSAIRRIDEAWNNWLTEYLANHRCG